MTDEESDYDEPRVPPPPPTTLTDSQPDNDLNLNLPSEDEDEVQDAPPPVTLQDVLPNSTGDVNEQQRELGEVDLGHQAASVDVAMAQVVWFSCTCKYFNSTVAQLLHEVHDRSDYAFKG